MLNFQGFFYHTENVWLLFCAKCVDSFPVDIAEKLIPDLFETLKSFGWLFFVFALE